MARRDQRGRPAEHPKSSPESGRDERIKLEADSETDTDASEYDAFHDLASKLVKVPKKELDEARERERLAKG